MAARTLKNTLNKHARPLVAAYRDLRHRRAIASSPAVPTRFGFTLCGAGGTASATFEEDEIAVFRAHLDTAALCIDVGANVGLYTCLAASQGKHVVAVEPLPSNLSFLYKNLLQNGLSAEVFPVGLGARFELKPLYGSHTSASFVNEWASNTSWSTVVPVSTLDAIAGRRFEGQRLLIKLDVEGFEYELLRGAKETLRIAPAPVWIIEICLDEHFPGGHNQNFLKTFELFWECGYEARVAGPSGRPVGVEDVKRWQSAGHCDFGSHNYLFTRQ